MALHGALWERRRSPPGLYKQTLKIFRPVSVLVSSHMALKEYGFKKIHAITPFPVAAF